MTTTIQLDGKTYALARQPRPNMIPCAGCAFDPVKLDIHNADLHPCSRANKQATCTPSSEGVVDLELIYEEVV